MCLSLVKEGWIFNVLVFGSSKFICVLKGFFEKRYTTDLNIATQMRFFIGKESSCVLSHTSPWSYFRQNSQLHSLMRLTFVDSVESTLDIRGHNS